MLIKIRRFKIFISAFSPSMLPISDIPFFQSRAQILTIKSNLFLMIFGFGLYVCNIVYSDRMNWIAFANGVSNPKTVLSMNEQQLKMYDSIPGFKNLKTFLVCSIAALLSTVPVIGLLVAHLFVRPPNQRFAKIYRVAVVFFSIVTFILTIIAIYLKASDLTEFIQKDEELNLSKSNGNFMGFQKVSFGLCVGTSLVFVIANIMLLCNNSEVKKYYENRFNTQSSHSGQYGASVCPPVQQYQSVNFNQQNAPVPQTQSGGFQASQAGPAIHRVVQDV